jgi:FtsH-binding integral membrane protein
MDDRLNAQWAADVPASDPRFVLAVMTRIEQRRFRRELARTMGLALCAVVLLGLLAPTVEFAWRDAVAPFASSNMTIFLALMGVTLALPYLLPAAND